MKPFIHKAFLLAVVLGLSSSVVMAKAPVVPETAPLKIQFPEFDMRTLSCGMKVIFLKADDMPLVSMKLIIPGGYALDPEGKEGLVGLMDDTLRNGGAGKLSPEAFDAALDDKAASMSASADTETFSEGFSCLSQDLPDILPLFADMVLRPQFDLKRFESNKADSLDSINRLEDTPDSLTRVVFHRAILADSPYGRWADTQSITSIKREDVVKFYQEHLGPTGSVLEVTGKIDEDKVMAQLEDLFGKWAPQEKLPEYTDSKPIGPTIYFYPKNVSQVFIRYGVLGLKRHDPRDIALTVANYILGGSGFTSRLMRQIRSDRGLAYFVDSVAEPYNIRGIFEVVGGTRPDTVKDYLTVMFKVLDDFAKTGPTEAELKEAKESIVEEYAYNFESPFTTAAYEGALIFDHYPNDYLKTYREKIKAVTRAQAAEAARAILDQKNWVMVVAGPEGLEKELEAFGPVHKMNSVFGPLVAKP